MAETMDPGLVMGVVHLSVADLGRSLQFYNDVIGLRTLHAGGGNGLLGVAGEPLLRLKEQPGARPAQRYPGLFHFALRVPTRAALAHTLRHLAAARAPFAGFSDHRVSEAIYLTDPDGHGIEIYRDRPREDWVDEAGNFYMTTDPLDVDGLLAETAPAAWEGLPAGTDMGHVHLQVSDVAAARDFYMNVLGFGHMTDYPGATFLSVGGYHHHLGLNAWNSGGAPPAPDHAARLLAFELLLPDPAALAAAVTHARAAGGEVAEIEAGALYRLRDPSGNQLLLRAA